MPKAASFCKITALIALFFLTFTYLVPLLRTSTPSSTMSHSKNPLLMSCPLRIRIAGHRGSSSHAPENTLSDIAVLDAGSWIHAEFTGEKVPLLRDALILARQRGIILQLELKIYDINSFIFAKLRTLIDELDCADLLQFSSFDFLQLREIKKMIPEVPTVGISHSRFIDLVYVARKANVDAMDLEIQHFPKGGGRGCCMRQG